MTCDAKCDATCDIHMFLLVFVLAVIMQGFYLSKDFFLTVTRYEKVHVEEALLLFEMSEIMNKSEIQLYASAIISTISLPGISI